MNIRTFTGNDTTGYIGADLGAKPRIKYPTDYFV